MLQLGVDLGRLGKQCTSEQAMMRQDGTLPIMLRMRLLSSGPKVKKLDWSFHKLPVVHYIVETLNQLTEAQESCR